MSLTEFLEARIAEDEEVATAATWSEGNYSVYSYLRPVDGLHIERHNPTRVLAECEAKRRIVDELRNAERMAAKKWPRRIRGEVNEYLRSMRVAAYALASAYYPHPDYRDEWRP